MQEAVGPVRGGRKVRLGLHRMAGHGHCEAVPPGSDLGARRAKCGERSIGEGSQDLQIAITAGDCATW